MKLAKYVLPLIALFAFLGGPVRAQETEKDLEEALRKLDDYYKKLRKELEEKLRQKREGDKPSTGDKEGKAFVGFTLSPVTKGVRVLLNLEGDEGVAVKKVVEGGPAEAAGLKVHDIILAANGRKVGSVEDMAGIVKDLKPGDKLSLRIMRDGKRTEAELVAGAKGGKEPDDGKQPGKAESEIDKFLDQSHQARRALIAGFLKDMLGDDMEKRLKARRFFERLASQSKENRERIIKEIEKAAESLIADLSEKEKEQLRKVFEDILGGFKDAFRKGGSKRSQKVEDIEQFLNDLLSGKKKEGAKPSEDEVDKLIEDLLGEKKGKGDGKEGDKQEFEIPKETEDMIKAFLGKEGWDRIKEMLKDPSMREMARQYMPKDFKLTGEWIRKLMAQFGVTEEELPDRLREMGLDETAIRKILDLLKKTPETQPAASGKGWLGVKAGDIEKEQLDKLGIAGGVMVTSVTEGGPAEKAGIRLQDVVLKVNDAEIKNSDDFRNALLNVKAGEALKLVVLRDGYRKVVTVVLGEKK